MASLKILIRLAFLPTADRRVCLLLLLAQFSGFTGSRLLAQEPVITEAWRDVVVAESGLGNW